MNLDVPPIAIQRDRHGVFRHNQRTTLRDIGNFGDSSGKCLTNHFHRHSERSPRSCFRKKARGRSREIY